jgi:tetratricopeptide (TPR) repeat protein
MKSYLRSKSDIQKMIDEGFELLNQYNYDEAIKLGKKLQRLRHSSSFEILALAYRGKGKLKKAIKILQEGVLKAPSVWRLWQLLGNYRSDEGLLPEAHHAYQKALKCPEADLSSIHLNRAIVFARQAKHSNALGCLNRVTDPMVASHAQILKIDILTSLGKYKEVVKLGKNLLRKIRKLNVNEQARVIAKLAIAEWNFGQKRNAVTHAWKAIEIDKKQSDASWLIREAEGAKSPKSKYFRLLVEGRWFKSIEGVKGHPGFFVNYDVVAENKEEALEFLKRFEPKKVRKSLKISEAKVLQQCPNLPKGVYQTLGYGFYPTRKSRKR